MSQYAPAEIGGILVQNISIPDRKNLRNDITCPFDGSLCNKKDHVCTVKQYEPQSDLFHIEHPLVALCPRRLRQDNTVLDTIASLFDGTTHVRLPEYRLPYNHGDTDDEGVSRLDYMLANNSLLVGVEVQTVYFSGDAMSADIDHIMESSDTFPEPIGTRHPDYKSSSNKRLWPQLESDWNLLHQQKTVPNVKLAVVVDRSFFNTLPFRSEGLLSPHEAEVVLIVVDFNGESSITIQTEMKFASFEAVKRMFTNIILNCRKFQNSIQKHLNEIY